MRDLVPEDQIWRTGANQCTRITLTDKLYFNGNVVPKGTYSLWTIPGKEEWTIILNNELTWGTRYETIRDSDFLRFKVVPEYSDTMIETFEIRFTDVSTGDRLSRGKFSLLLENTIVGIDIVDDFVQKLGSLVNTRIAEVRSRELLTRKDSAWAANNFYRAAIYNQTYTDNLEISLEWLDHAITLLPVLTFQYAFSKAEILRGLDRRKEAIEVATIALRSAQEQPPGRDRGFTAKISELINELKSN